RRRRRRVRAAPPESGQPPRTRRRRGRAGTAPGAFRSPPQRPLRTAPCLPSSVGETSALHREFRMADFQKKVVVVGAGTMGSQIALQTAYSGHYMVELVDSSTEQLERARRQSSALVQRSVEKGRLAADQGAAALDRISAHEDLSASLAGAALVIEAVFEDLETKLGVWREIGRGAPAD